ADQLARAGRNLPRGETTIGAPAPAVTPVQVAAVAIVPPRRPAGLGAPLAPVAPQVVASAPLPPIRPSILVSVAAAEKAPAPLPDLIRQGAEPAVGLLAYAPAGEGLALRGTVLPP